MSISLSARVNSMWVAAFLSSRSCQAFAAQTSDGRLAAARKCSGGVRELQCRGVVIRCFEIDESIWLTEQSQGRRCQFPVERDARLLACCSGSLA